MKKSTVVLLLTCADQTGLVYKITDFIFRNNGNIIDLDEHVDQNEGMFFLRVAWDMPDDIVDKEKLKNEFAPLAIKFNAVWEIYTNDVKKNAAVFVSKYDHCLQEILWRNNQEEFNINIALIISNHQDLQSLADHYKIPFHYFQIRNDNKIEVESKQLGLLKEHNVETIILARYMQILSPAFVQEYPNKIINIHHSFLPAFVGSNPYRQAYERGVKIIGATSHYVTNELDQGPIIEQDIIRISHDDNLKDLIRKGRDLERLVLAKALLLHSQFRILVHGQKTVVFT